MSCGTRIKGFAGSYHERVELADKLEDSGEHRTARAVRRGDCLDDRTLRKAEMALEYDHGLHRDYDYKEARCFCEDERDSD